MTAIAHAGHAPSATTGIGHDHSKIQRIELPVAGLTCGACVRAVETALRAVAGVSRATVNLTQGRAFVDYDSGQTTVAALIEAIKAAGYRSETATIRLRIEGITCASCVTTIERALRATPGVLAATVGIGSEEAVVEYVPSVTNLPAVKAAVGSAGYRIVDTPAPAAPRARSRGSSSGIPDVDAAVVVRRRRRRLHDGPELPVALPVPA
jgi:Cu+-exporting ATPase